MFKAVGLVLTGRQITARTNVASFIVVSPPFAFCDVKYHIKPCNIDIRLRIVVFTTNERSKSTVCKVRVSGKPNVSIKMAEPLYKLKEWSFIFNLSGC